MLVNKEAIATVAVKDLKKARTFYEGVLGLTPVEGAGDGEVIVYQSGNSNINVYRSQFAGTNQATSVTWNVGKDIEKVVRELKAKGAAFEHYDMPGMKREGDVHLFEKIKAAWLKDPDGNILSLISS